MKDCLHFRTEPRKLPVVFSAEEVFEILRFAPGPGLKYRAALSISYGTGLRASEVCNLKVGDTDSPYELLAQLRDRRLEWRPRAPASARKSCASRLQTNSDACAALPCPTSIMSICSLMDIIPH